MSDEIEMRASEEMPPNDAPIAVGEKGSLRLACPLRPVLPLRLVLLPRLTFRLLLKMWRRLEPLKRSPRFTLETTG